MLSVFPDILAFSLVAPLLLRVASGVIIFGMSVRSLGKERADKILCFDEFGLRPGATWVPVVGVIELVGAVLLVVGAWTQVTALVLALIMLGAAIMKRQGAKALSEPVAYYVLLLVVLISLVFSGAGFFAFDLPL